jgi:hypothetical protein
MILLFNDRLCDLVARVLGYRSGGPVSIPGTTRFSGGGGEKIVGLERGSAGNRTRASGSVAKHSDY